MHLICCDFSTGVHDAPRGTFAYRHDLDRAAGLAYSPVIGPADSPASGGIYDGIGNHRILPRLWRDLRRDWEQGNAAILRYQGVLIDVHRSL